MTARAVACCLLLVAGAVRADPRKSVLLVFDEDKDLPGLAQINRSVRDGLKARLGANIEFYSESLALSQFTDAQYDGVLGDYFRRKYAGKHLDLAVAVMQPSLDFLLRHRAALFPGLPIVFCGIDASDVDGKEGSDLTGVLIRRTFAPTLEIALRLQPDVRNVFVVAGSSRFDQRLLAIARRDFEPFGNRAPITYLPALPFDDLLNTLSHLPPSSAIVYLTFFADGAGRAFSPHAALARIAAVANAPVYVAIDQYVGLGAVGGHVYSIASQGRRAAEIGLRILGGESASSIPVVEADDYQDVFDSRQLRRWELDESSLPPESVVRFRTPSPWELYKWYISAGMLLFVVQSGLVVGLLLSRAQRRRADRAAREAEERRRCAEEEAQREREELAHALRLTTLGEMTASFAHEVGQPLTAILANAQAAEQLLASGYSKPRDVADALADIATDAKRAAETIRRLRALFRKQHAERTEVDMNALVEDVLALVQSEMTSKGICVRLVRAGDIPKVAGDPVQLRQVVLNLLVNSADAIGVAADGPRDIRVRTHGIDGHVAIEVRDSGVGVSEPDLERIFEHFVTSKPQGLGMGLAISRSIVEAHQGRIWATRNDDRGLTLHVELPVDARGERSGTTATPMRAEPREHAS